LNLLSNVSAANFFYLSGKGPLTRLGSGLCGDSLRLGLGLVNITISNYTGKSFLPVTLLTVVVVAAAGVVVVVRIFVVVVVDAAPVDAVVNAIPLTRNAQRPAKPAFVPVVR